MTAVLRRGIILRPLDNNLNICGCVAAMRLNEALRALSDPTRREIVRLLRRGEMSAGELAERFDMSKPSVSHHFSTLKEAGLITSRRQGQQVLYSLNTTVLEDLMASILGLFGISSPEDPLASGSAPEDSSNDSLPRGGNAR